MAKNKTCFSHKNSINFIDFNFENTLLIGFEGEYTSTAN